MQKKTASKKARHLHWMFFPDRFLICLASFLSSKVGNDLVSKHFNVLEVTFAPEPYDKVVGSCFYKSLQHLYYVVWFAYPYRGPSNAIWDLHCSPFHLLHQFRLVHCIFCKILAKVKL